MNRHWLSPLVSGLVLLLLPLTASAQSPQHLTLSEARDRALQNSPRIQAGQFAALEAAQRVREVRSAYFPTLVANVTGATAPDNTRITAGALNNPTILDRVGIGASMLQTITDFGRTSDLSASASLAVDAQKADVTDRRATVLLDVDRAYFGVLRAQAVQRVAEQTVAARQLAVDQVRALSTSGLKSGLDLSVATVNLGEAQLLLAQARNDLQAAYALLSAALGVTDSFTYVLDEETLPAAPPATPDALVAAARRERADLARERLRQQSSDKFADAEATLARPTVSLAGAAGLTPAGDPSLNSTYAAVGVNVSFPVANGSLFAARRTEARLRVNENEQAVRDLETRIVRDVQLAWLDANTAYQRLGLTDQLLSQARDAADLAQQRYDLGLTSIVELTQTQLSLTRAQIDQASARYEYQARTSALLFATGALK
jgi:outer membrane protein